MLSGVAKLQALAALAEQLPIHQRASRFAELARMLRKSGEAGAAVNLALRAAGLARETGNADVLEDTRRALAAMTPAYHTQISTDPTRIAAWEKALTSRIKPGMLALEIGAGSGILALLAARAGAQVVSCENDPVIAAVAETVVSQNGLSDAVKVVSRPVEALNIPQDLPGPADFLLLDLFSDNLFGFLAFDILRAARPLLSDHVAVAPMRVSLQVALGDYRLWERLIPGQVAGFDLTPLRDVASLSRSVDVGSPDLMLRSDAKALVSASLPHDLPASRGVVEAQLASTGGRVTGAVAWIRLDLAEGVSLEARPGGPPAGYYARPNIHAFDAPIETTPGQTVGVRLRWKDATVQLSLAQR